MKSKNDTLFQAVVYVLTALICLITLYPLIYVLSASFSDPARILGAMWCFGRWTLPPTPIAAFSPAPIS